MTEDRAEQATKSGDETAGEETASENVADTNLRNESVPMAKDVDQVMSAAAAEEAAAPSIEFQLRDAEDRALRHQAELENYRKRMQREMEQNRKYAAVAVIRDLLDVVDNLSLAIQSAGENEASSGLIQGVSMVADQFSTVLRQHQCERIKDLGEAFDPNVHEAMAQEPSDEYPAGTISRVTRTGFQIHDRVVRPTQVFVSTGPAAPPQPKVDEVDIEADGGNNETSDSDE